MKNSQRTNKIRSIILFSLSIGTLIVYGCGNGDVSYTKGADGSADTDTATGNHTDTDTDPDAEIDSETDMGTNTEFDPENPERSGYQLVFEDEFDGTELDSSKWAPCPEWFRQGGSWWEADNHRLTGTGQVRLDVTEVDGTVYCGAIRTMDLNFVPLFEQKYGYFETRCTTPQIHGGWAAFWLMPANNAPGDEGNDGTEVDVFETINGWKNSVNQALHWDGYGSEHQTEGWTMDGREDLYDGGYHTFGFLWTPEEYVFYIDGVETWRTSAGGVSDVPQYMKLTLEVSGETWPGDWSDQKEIPYYWYVDYVKAYQLN